MADYTILEYKKYIEEKYNRKISIQAIYYMMRVNKVEWYKNKWNARLIKNIKKNNEIRITGKV